MDPMNKTIKKRKKMALGKGLDALIPTIDTEETTGKDYFFCDVDVIRPNRYQPRRHFSDSELAELSESIKNQGIIQPLLVQKHEDGYELIAGERRLRAAKLAGLAKVPVVVKDTTESELLELSIVENIQREDLNPMDEADAYHRLITEFNLTQEETASRVGKSRSAVANFLRLRQLPDQIKDGIIKGKISMGHARALLGADTQEQQKTVYRAVVGRGISVRETENLIKRLRKNAQKTESPKSDPDDIYFSDLADHLARRFGTKVRIIRRGKKGKVELEFYSDDDLDRLIQRLKNG